MMNEFQVFAGVAICFSLLFSLFSCIIATIACVQVISLQKSTHNIQFVPVDEEIDKENQEFMKQQWATQPGTLDEQQKLFREDLEDLMPEFAPSEDDKKIKSW